ncbi:MAG: flagellar biosynthesis protein FlgD [Nitrincola sp.]|nr:flagellar biosynthesis protein FlgD [Nitrincola sp.]
MKLMIAQLQNQDPTSPADTGQFMQQISSMTMVETMTEMSKTFQTMSNSLLSSQSALQASSMVGQRVFINSDIANLSQQGGALPGTVSLPSSTTDLRISIYDRGGALVDRVNLGQTQAGERSFVWNASEEVPAGNYQIVAEAFDGERYRQVDTWMPFTVNSVSLGQNGIGMKVNTAIGSIDFSDVKQLG